MYALTHTVSERHSVLVFCFTRESAVNVAKMVASITANLLHRSHPNGFAGDGVDELLAAMSLLQKPVGCVASDKHRMTPIAMVASIP